MLPFSAPLPVFDPRIVMGSILLRVIVLERRTSPNTS
jgi:hypothetical protein